MSRPPRCRLVGHLPPSGYFKPRGIPMADLEEIVLTVDELESLRLADYEHLYQEEAAGTMSVSRQTFGRILAGARKKVTEALVYGKALKIEGGEFRTPSARAFQCDTCGNAWESPCGTGHPTECPLCHSQAVRRAVSVSSVRMPGEGSRG